MGCGSEHAHTPQLGAAKLISHVGTELAGPNYAMRAGPQFLSQKDQTEDAMKRDFLVISAAMLAVYAALSMFWSGPDKPPRMHTIQQIDAAPELKLVSEQSPYMRNER